MPPQQWYQNSAWDAETEKAFLARLTGEREHRDQYLALQALSLAPNHPQAALRLASLYFDTRTDDLEDVSALLARARAYRVVGPLERCIESYKAVIRRELTFPDRRTDAFVELPYLVALSGAEADYAYAVRVLDEGLERVLSGAQRFQWNAAYALIALARGNRSAASGYARVALEAADLDDAGGCADHAEVSRRLRELAG